MNTTAPTASSTTQQWVRIGLVLCALFGFLALKSVARGDDKKSELFARGEYLANSVAMCVQCHSGRDSDFNIIEAQKFRGGAIPVLPPNEGKRWAFRAPNISGLPGFTDDQIVSLLTTGAIEGRQPPKPPMPPFRMNADDAKAIAAYLRNR